MIGSTSKTIRSDSDGFPTAISAVEHMIAELATSSHWSWVTFEIEGLTAFVEVAVENGSLLVNFSYPYSDHYSRLFAERGIVVPDEWSVRDFRTPGWFRKGAMLLAGNRDQRITATFVILLFSKLYRAPHDAVLTGTFQC